MNTTIRFFGTRGSFPVTGAQYAGFGGATTCLLVTCGDTKIMVDAGSGVSSALPQLREAEELHLLVTHPHLDHVSGFPQLATSFMRRRLHVYGAVLGGRTVEEQLGMLMDAPFWPLPLRACHGVTCHTIGDEPFSLGPVTVRTMASNHPGGCTLYRLECPDKTIVIAFDFNHADGFKDRLIRFAEGADVIIYDGNMTEEEYASFSEWGHSTPDIGAAIAAACGAARLVITHHNTAADDDTLSAREEQLKRLCPSACFAREGMEIR